ncbi:MAG TPA: class I SAM-dependent methyltransferase, partial [bacterium]|nr:class I SAM-dependent methyltransferase [bacterium]
KPGELHLFSELIKQVRKEQGECHGYCMGHAKSLADKINQGGMTRAHVVWGYFNIYDMPGQDMNGNYQPTTYAFPAHSWVETEDGWVIDPFPEGVVAASPAIHQLIDELSGGVMIDKNSERAHEYYAGIWNDAVDWEAFEPSKDNPFEIAVKNYALLQKEKRAEVRSAGIDDLLPGQMGKLKGMRVFDGDEKMTALFKKAKVERVAVSRKTEAGLYVPTPGRILDKFIGLLKAQEIKKKRKPLVILDAGSGQGEAAIQMANALAAKRYRFQVIGIEYDKQLFNHSQRLLDAAYDDGYVKRGQVLLFQGDYNTRKFIKYFKRADIVYYYALGTDKPEALAKTILETLKPGASLVVSGYTVELDHLLMNKKIHFNVFRPEAGPFVRIYTRSAARQKRGEILYDQSNFKQTRSEVRGWVDLFAEKMNLALASLDLSGLGEPVQRREMLNASFKDMRSDLFRIKQLMEIFSDDDDIKGDMQNALRRHTQILGELAPLIDKARPYVKIETYSKLRRQLQETAQAVSHALWLLESVEEGKIKLSDKIVPQLLHLGIDTLMLDDQAEGEPFDLKQKGKEILEELYQSSQNPRWKQGDFFLEITDSHTVLLRRSERPSSRSELRAPTDQSLAHDDLDLFLVSDEVIFKDTRTLASIEPIIKKWPVPIRSREDAFNIVELPLIPAVWRFIQMGIKTQVSSANRKNIERHSAWLGIDYDSLSSEDKRIADALVKRKTVIPGVSAVMLDSWIGVGKKTLVVRFSVNETTTVGELARRAFDFAAQFSEQKDYQVNATASLSRAEVRRQGTEVKISKYWQKLAEVVLGGRLLQAAEAETMAGFIRSELRRVGLSNFAAMFKETAFNQIQEESAGVDEWTVKTVQILRQHWRKVLSEANQGEDTLTLGLYVSTEDSHITVEGFVKALLGEGVRGGLKRIIASGGNIKAIHPFHKEMKTANLTLTTVANPDHINGL